MGRLLWTIQSEKQSNDFLYVVVFQIAAVYVWKEYHVDYINTMRQYGDEQEEQWSYLEAQEQQTGGKEHEKTYCLLRA